MTREPRQSGAPWRLAALAATLLWACGPSQPPHVAVSYLSSPDPEDRREAARDIEAAAREDGGLHPQITEVLLQRAPSEPDVKTKASLMFALAHTGDPRAKPVLDGYALTDDKAQRRYATKALRKWAVKAGYFPPSYDFPSDWPYGTPGYPPPLP